MTARSGNADNALKTGQSVIRDEAEALVALAESLGDVFTRAVALILSHPGQTIVTGVGKSGIIAQKIAATLASTGTNAKFLHPVEGLHGDLGMVQDGDTLIALSKSGHTEELVRFVGHYKRIGGAVIGICESAESPLAELSELHLPIPRRTEAGPLQLAPTTSTTLMLALGDALAMALLDARGFAPEQFARFHPEGSLGKRLLLRATDIMHQGGELPRVAADVGFTDVLLEMTGKHLGMTCIVEADGTLLGVVTDGDLRRLFMREREPARLDARAAYRLSRRDPDDVPVPHSTVMPDTLAVDCLRIMRDAQISSLVIAREDRVPVGIVRWQDLLRAGLS